MELGFIYSIGAAILWGLVYTIDQKILSGINPMTLLFVDSIVAAIIMLPFMFFSNGSLRTFFISGKSSILLIVLSMILATAANFLIFSGIKSLGASYASIIEIAYPFFVVLFTFIVFKATPNIYFFVGGLLIFIGSAIIIYFN